MRDFAVRVAREQWDNLSREDRECVRNGMTPLRSFEEAECCYRTEFYPATPSPTFSRLFGLALQQCARIDEELFP